MPIRRIRPSFTLDEDRIDELRGVVPEAFADGKIRWEVLKEALGGSLEDEDDEAERFGLFWPGKREARRLANKPSQGTLVSQPGLGVNEENTHNVFVEGENLEILKALKKAYAGQVKMIYIDPPYNTGGNRIYPDDYSEPLESYLQREGRIDEEGQLLTTNSKAGGRFHSRWLSMLYPRLLVARQLLQRDGAIFISIDDSEAHHLRMVADEVFGEENFISQMVWEGALKNDSTFVSNSHDYIVCYAKSLEDLKLNDGRWRTRKEGIDTIYEKVSELKTLYGSDYTRISKALREWYSELTKNDKNNPAWQHRHYNRVDERGVYFPGDISWPGGGGPKYEVLHPNTGSPVRIPAGGWRYTSETLMDLIARDRIYFGPDERRVPNVKRYLHETEGQVLPSVIYKDRRGSMQRLRDLFEGKDVFDNPKDEEVLMKIVEAATSESEIIMDFFAGSCAGAHAVLKMNREDGSKRRFVMIQIDEPVDPAERTGENALTLGLETVADIGRDRIHRVIDQMETQREDKSSSKPNEDLGFKYYHLSRSNYRPWQDIEGAEVEQIEMAFDRFETPLVEDWDRADLFTEVLLIEGFPLDSDVESQEQFSENEVQLVTSDFHDHRLLVCLDDEIKDQTIAHLRMRADDVFICLDTALNDESKVRLSDTGNLHII